MSDLVVATCYPAAPIQAGTLEALVNLNLPKQKQYPMFFILFDILPMGFRVKGMMQIRDKAGVTTQDGIRRRQE